MILSTEQASAVYRAMKVLNSLPAVLHTRILCAGMTTHVQEYLTGEVNVWRGERPGNPVGGVERYASQDEFRRAYNLRRIA